MKRNLIIIFIAIFIFVAGFSACNQTATTPPASSKDYKIGAILPMTGTSAVLGEFNKNGMDIAVEELNARPNAPKIYSVEYGDSKNDPKEGVLVFQQQASVQKLPIIVSAMSSVTGALAQPAAENNKLLMATMVSSAGITENQPNMFRLFVRADIDAKTMADYAVKNAGLKKAAILFVQDDFGASFRDVFKQNFEAGGGKVTVEEGFDRAATDFRAVLTKLKGADFDCLYLLGYERTMGLIPKQMRELGINQPVLSIGTLAQPYVMEQAGNAIDGSYFTSTEFDADNPKSDAAKNFVAKYEAKFGKKPNYFAAFAYDTVRVLARAVEDAGANSADAKAVADALRRIKDFPGAVGAITFEPNGDARFPMHVSQIKNGRVENVSK